MFAQSPLSLLPVANPLVSPQRNSSKVLLRFRCRSSPVSCRASCHAVSMPELDSRRPTSLYEILRVNQNASRTEIKSAYRTLAKMYHPDAMREADDRGFIEIHNAYATLSDPLRRQIYDLSLGDRERRRRPVRCRSVVYQTRRWETDQCW